MTFIFGINFAWGLLCIGISLGKIGKLLFYSSECILLSETNSEKLLSNMSKQINKKNVCTKQEQFETLVTIMEENRSFATRYMKTPDAKKKSNSLWEKIQQDLNTMGPPVHDVEGWKKVWAGYKDHIKNKMKKNKHNISGTGGGPSKLLSFTPTEQKVIDLLQLEKCFSGLITSRKFGTPEENNKTVPSNQSVDALMTSVDHIIATEDAIDESQENIEDGIDLPLGLDKTTSVAKRQPRKQLQNQRMKLLHQQVESQGDFHKIVVQKLDSVNQSLKDMCSNMEKSYSLSQRHFEKMEQIEKQRNELLIQKLELKKKIVNIKEKRLNG